MTEKKTRHRTVGAAQCTNCSRQFYKRYIATFTASYAKYTRELQQIKNISYTSCYDITMRESDQIIISVVTEYDSNPMEYLSHHNILALSTPDSKYFNSQKSC